MRRNWPKSALGAIVVLVLLGSSRPAFAEGSKELAANGGNRGRLEWRDDTTSNIARRSTIKVFVKPGEILNLGSSAQGVGAGRMNLRRPDNTTLTSGGSTTIGRIVNHAQELAGALPNSGGYTPFTTTVGANQGGVWEIDFVSPHPATPYTDPGLIAADADWPAQAAADFWSTAWDVVVRDGSGATKLGRTYTNSLAMMMGANGGSYNGPLYVATKEGYQYLCDFSTLDPYGWIFFSNSRGFKNANGDPRYQSMAFPINAPQDVHDPNLPDTWADVTNKIFFNTPNSDMPATAPAPTGSGGSTWLVKTPVAPPAPQNFGWVGSEGTAGAGGTYPLGGHFTFTSTVIASYKIIIDVNRDGILGPLPDRVLDGISLIGTNNLSWDGLDGNGAVVPASTTPYTAKITLNAGEIHFPILDAENNPSGLRWQRLNNPIPPTTPLPDPWMVYYDDRNLTPAYAGNYALYGVSSQGRAHAYPTMFGDVKGIDTWAYYPSDETPVPGGVPLREADLSVTKTHVPAAVTRGTAITYTLVVRNSSGLHGSSDVTGAQFLDPIPAGIAVSSWTSTVTGTGLSNPASGSTNNINCTVNLTNGSYITYTVHGTVLSTALGSLTNTATILRPLDTNDSDDPNRTGAGNNSATDALSTADLELTMTTSNPSPNSNSNFSYTLTLTNRGPSSATGVQVQDILPVTYRSDSPSQGTYTSSTGIWDLGATALASGASATLVLNVRNNGTAQKINTAQVWTAGQYDPDSIPANSNALEDDQARVITNSPNADLSVTQTVSAAPYQVGQNVVFTVNVTDATGGSNVNATGVHVKDLLPAGLTYVSSAPPAGTTYDSATGDWNVGSVTTGQTRTLTITARIDTVGAKTNTAEVSLSDQYDPDSTPNNNVAGEDDQASQTLTPQVADLSVTDAVSVPTPDVGTNTTFTITVHNAGPDTATNIIVRDHIQPSYLTYVSSTVTAGTYSSSTGNWTIASLASGATQTLTVTATMLYDGRVQNIAQVVAADQHDPDSTPNNNDAAEDDQAGVYVTGGAHPIPTAVAVDAITAERAAEGVLLTWHAASEFQNLGFHLWRRPFGEGAYAWERITARLVPGRITNAAEKTYSWMDWPEAGLYEYRLESVSLLGGKEFYPELAGPVETWSEIATDEEPPAPEVLGAILNRALIVLEDERGAQLARVAVSVAGARSAVAEAVRLEVLPSRQSAAKSGTGVASEAAHSLTASGQATVASLTAVTTSGTASSQAVAAPQQSSPSSNQATAAPQVVAVSRDPAGSPAGATGVTAAPIGNAGVLTFAKVLVRGAGVVWIPAAGLPAGYDPTHVLISREGAAVSALGASPDGLALYAPGYEDRYTDKDAFFLTAGDLPTPTCAAGISRVLFTRNIAAVKQTDAVARSDYHDVYFDWSLRPLDFPPWFSSKYLQSGGVQDFTLSVSNLAGGPQTLTVELWSLTDTPAAAPNHALQVFVNGTPLGDTTWTGGAQALRLTFDIPSGVLRNGDNQVELRTPALAGVDAQVAFVHSLQVKYSRWLRGPGPVAVVGQPKPAVYEVTGLTSSQLWVVNTTKPAAQLVPSETRAAEDGTFTVRFAGQGKGISTFLVVERWRELAPVSVAARTIQPLPQGLRYLAVGPAQFGTPLKPLLDRRTAEGLNAAFVDQEDCFDLFGSGRYGPEPIRLAAQSLQPAYLLLVGRSTYDYRNWEGRNLDPLCPSFLASTTFWSETTAEAQFGIWSNPYPEVSIGRLPANTAGEVSAMVSRILAYQGIGASGARGLLVADQADPQAGDFALAGDQLIAATPQVAWAKSYYGVTHLTAAEVTADIRAAACGDADLILYFGHGKASRWGLASPGLLYGGAAQTWTGNVVTLAGTCNANTYNANVAGYQSLAMQLLTQPSGGIPISVAPSTYMLSMAAEDFSAVLLGAALGDPAVRWGDALRQAQRWASEKGQSLRLDNRAGDAGWYEDLMRVECILGDPALPVFQRPAP